jgi:hypothetical protein
MNDVVAPWDFPYEPLRSADLPAGGRFVVATSAVLACDVLVAVEALLGEALTWETVLARAPLFWTRVCGPRDLSAERLASALASAGAALRYVAPEGAASATLAPALACDPSMRARPTDWRARPATRRVTDHPRASRWFLDAKTGLHVDRRRCGTGAGTRLAVIDNDGGESQLVGFEREIPIGVENIGRGSPHGSLMAAWAVGASGAPGSPGVAPDASARLYVIPKPGTDVVSLPRAIAQAVFDGADVVVCATYMEQTWSPMLDDALAVATRLGRAGRGTAVVVACGREGSSPPDSVHASWSLSLGDPASDPRVFCIGPSGRHGGWFLWRDKRGKLRPFANRGPSIRWLAPGDDLADPLELRDRWCHAESSGASALAAGVLLLVVGANPRLRLRELDAIVTATASPIVADHTSLDASPADPFDLLPRGTDADGHNAKHGYGRMNALRACLAARDPICASLLRMGDEDAAVSAFDLLDASRPYSRATARWAARRMLADASTSHALRALLRHLRLLASDPGRGRAHVRGALARQLALFVGALARDANIPPRVAADLARISKRLGTPVESEIVRASARLWDGESGEAGAASAEPTHVTEHASGASAP